MAEKEAVSFSINACESFCISQLKVEFAQTSRICLTHLLNMLATRVFVLAHSVSVHHLYCFLRLFNNYLVC